MLAYFITGNVTSHKKTKKLKNGGIVVMNTKTIVGGDIINIGEGANIVSVNLGERRRPKSRQSKPSKTKPGTFCLMMSKFGHKVIQLLSCSNELSMKFLILIKTRMMKKL